LLPNHPQQYHKDYANHIVGVGILIGPHGRHRSPATFKKTSTSPHSHSASAPPGPVPPASRHSLSP
jgi:hypothetical protein